MGRTGCVLVALLAVALPSAPPAAATVPTTDRSQTVGFIDALVAIPKAAEAVAAARVVVRDARARAAIARSVAADVTVAFGEASDTLHEQTLLRTRTELASDQAQESLDDVARQMYSTGGGVPSLVDVMLTAESEDSLMRSLVTRQYLSSAAGDRVQAGLQADTAAVAAEASRAQAEFTWSLAADNWRNAAAGLATATHDLTAAQKAARGARKKYKALMSVTGTDHSADYGRIKDCGDWLIRLLAKTGFEGENLREAWAIVMRESGGREDAISRSNDLGLFQINTATWQGQPWFDRESLLKRKFNAKVGFLLSQGGASWYSWGLDGHGRPDPGAYVKAGWSDERIVAKIIEPYVAWYSLYPCRPAYEKNLWETLPIDIAKALTPRAEDDGSEPLAAGGGQLPSAASSSEPQPEPSVTDGPAVPSVVPSPEPLVTAAPALSPESPAPAESTVQP